MPNQKEIKALISLLDDPDEQIYAQIKSKLISFGQEVIPELENYWEHNSFGVIFQDRIENIIHKIQFDKTSFDIKQWSKGSASNLLDFAILISKYQYPDLNEDKILKKVEQLERDVWIEMNNDLTAFEKVKVLNHILFDVHGFIGNKKNYHAPQNSYINNVIDTKKGNPLTLSLLYYIIAQRLNLPIYGVNLPNHFVLCYLDEHAIMKIIEPGTSQDDDVLFYINPFSRGTIFNRDEIYAFLKQLNLDPQQSYFEPCNNKDIAKRIINNLIYSYEKLGYVDKVEELEILKSYFQ